MIAINGIVVDNQEAAFVNGAPVGEMWHNGALVYKHEQSEIILPTEIKLSGTPLLMRRGEEVQLTATVYPENATEKQVTWVSSNSNIATVNNTGLVRGIASGSIMIFAITVNGGRIFNRVIGNNLHIKI